MLKRSDFIDKIKQGSDIMFDVDNKHYTILTWMDEGIGIGEQYPNESELRFFKTAEDLVDNF